MTNVGKHGWMVAIAAALLVACSGTDDPNGSGKALDHIVLSAPQGQTTIAVNETWPLAAKGMDAAGGDVSLGQVTWASSDAGIVAVDANGTLSGKAHGAATISAESAGKKATYEVHVVGALHRGHLTANETWHEIDNPHRLIEDVFVAGAGTPVLTIEAGVEARFAAGTSLQIGFSEGGSIKVQGTSEKPVRFVADAAVPTPGLYGGLVLDDGTRDASIEQLVIDDGGKSGIWGDWDAAFIVLGAENRPVVKHLTVTKSATNGVSLAHQGAFGSGSEAIVVSGSGRYAMHLDDPDFVGTVPAGSTFDGNTPNALYVKAGLVSQTQAWANFAVPYVVDGTVEVHGVGTPVLTIREGTHLRFSSQGGLHVGFNEAGELKAQGSEAHPVLFTADAAQPQAGHWEGIVFHENASATSLLEHVVVEYGGSDASSGYPNANVQVIQDKGPIVKHTELRHSAGCGITRATILDEPFPTDFTLAALGNTFSDNASGPQCGP